MVKGIEEFIVEMEKRPGASQTAIQELMGRSWVTLPQDYLDLLRLTNGAEGKIGTSYLGLWSAEEVLLHNDGYRAREFVPGLFLFGSSMGGVAYAFDGREDRVRIVEVPFDSMDLDSIIYRGDTVEEFLRFLVTQWPEE